MREEWRMKIKETKAFAPLAGMARCAVRVFGVRGHDRAFERDDLSSRSPAVTCHRTPNCRTRFFPSRSGRMTERRLPAGFGRPNIQPGHDHPRRPTIKAGQRPALRFPSRSGRMTERRLPAGFGRPNIQPGHDHPRRPTIKAGQRPALRFPSRSDSLKVAVGFSPRKCNGGIRVAERRLTVAGFGVRGHDRAFKRDDMSSRSKAVTCHRTPKNAAVRAANQVRADVRPFPPLPSSLSALHSPFAGCISARPILQCPLSSRVCLKTPPRS